MFVLLMLGWWYQSGWGWLIRRVSAQLDYVREMFSISILLKTLFSPWKQIKSEKHFQDFLQVTLDNTISRFVGFTIRFWLLIFATILFLLILIFGLFAVIVWPFVPALLIVLPILSIVGY